MSGVFAWVKQMIFLLIFLTMAQQLLPGAHYRKYLRFLGGLIFIVTLMQPVISFLGADDWEETLYLQLYESGSEWTGDSDVEEMDFSEMEKIQSSLYQEYEERLTEDFAE